jgi:hypothetical protein
MKNHSFFFLFILCICNFLGCAQIKIPKIKLPSQTGAASTGNLSETEVINALKEALNIGARKASEQLHQTDGFNLNSLVRIPFPEDAKKVAVELRRMGYGKKVDEFELTLNRAAEQAAKEAAPVFISAIQQMTIGDAKNILTGPDTAATAYLRKTTYLPLYNAFSPHIQTALNDNFAASKWKDITTIYNKIPFVKKVDTDLLGFTTNKALKGVFVIVAQEELKIRQDPSARVTDLLRKVFGKKS